MYNDVVQIILDRNVKFKRLDDAQKLTRCVTNALWDIDSNHKEINAAFADYKCKQLPTIFLSIYNKQYNMWQQLKKPKPKLSHEKITTSSANLFDIVSACRAEKSSTEFINQCKYLAECLHSYANYLGKAKERMANLSGKDQTFIDKFVLPNVISGADKVKPQYQILYDQLQTYDFFEAMFVQNDLIKVPDDRKTRYKWYEDLAVSHS